MNLVLLIIFLTTCPLFSMAPQSSFSLINLPMRTIPADQIKHYCHEQQYADFCDSTGLDKLLGSQTMSVNYSLHCLESLIDGYVRYLGDNGSIKPQLAINVPDFLSTLYGTKKEWSPLFTIMINERAQKKKNDRPILS